MKKILSKIKNSKSLFLVLGIIIGLAITIGGVYAATVINASNIEYSNSSSGLTSTNLQDALDEAYTKAKKVSHCAEISGNTVTFKIGDYVQMTPTSTSYTIDKTMTGYHRETQIINPSELNLWRVIRINSDNTVDMVSEYVSSMYVTISGKTGYKNLVGYLNTIAHQYENSCYTIDSRHMGYSTQISYITDTTALTSTTAPQTASTSNSNVTSATEAKGLGDMGYEIDYNLVKTALGTTEAYVVGTKGSGYYWLASRYYKYDSSHDEWEFHARMINASFGLTSDILCYYSGIHCTDMETDGKVRPIVTLKSGVKASSGNGSSSLPYVLP